MTDATDPANEARLAKRREYDRLRYSRERERRIARALAWNKQNPEKAREGVKKWAQANRVKMREYARRSDSKRRPERAEANRKRRAAIAGALIAPFSSEALAQRLSMTGGLCWICRSAPATSVDHVKPISAGGPHMLANLRPACLPCNSGKGDTWPFRAGDAAPAH